MSTQEVYVIQPYKRVKRRLVAEQPTHCKSADEAMLRLTRLRDRDTVAGAIAFSIIVDTETGETHDDPRTLGRFGDLPPQFGDEDDA
ncbi:hypothetical protein [Aureimonas frigidaquae]|uniref:Uncharacterized protein n=1 Tax=Aureimonas frigidaquae TaxID=424757 RepID=A0A0N7KXY6_9HYPH|nr:hypothetical protein [Aureimonas frigidaquae]BAT28225.1 hypothetical protein [Aureimonas frigidaquae]